VLGADVVVVGAGILGLAVAREVRRAGVRAQALNEDGTLLDDFWLDRSPSVTHVRKAPSPAATSSLALAQAIVDEIEPGLA
jgi:L-2-hydroxyglutarate oxidase